MRPPSPDHARTGPRILLVEQDPARRDRLAALLAQQGFAVTPAASSEAALEALKHHRPALILAGARLAQTGGWELVHRIRAFDDKLPILLVGTTSWESSGTSGTADIQAVVPEDVDAPALLKEVARWLRQAPQPSRAVRWPGLVLVVDDEPDIRDVLKDFLESHGFRVAQASSGSEALDQFKQLSPAVAFLDIKMPGMDGLTTLRQLKAIQPAATVIMITGVEEEETMEEALALGAEDYILKPFNFEYLETILLSKMLLGPGP